MNIQSNGKKEVLNFINKNGRIPTFNEALDIYTENVLRSQRQCWLTVNGHKSSDKPMWKIIDSAKSWFRYAIGQLVIEGSIAIKQIDVDHIEATGPYDQKFRICVGDFESILSGMAAVIKIKNPHSGKSCLGPGCIYCDEEE